MGNKKRWAGAWLLMTVLAATAVAGDPAIKDDAEFFSGDAIRQVQSQLQSIKQQSGRAVVIETTATLPAELAGKIGGDPQAKEQAYGAYARQRLAATGADLYVFVNKSPAHIEAFSGPAGRSGFTGSDREMLVQQLGQQFRNKNFDAGLTGFAGGVQQVLGKAAGGSAAPPSPSRQPDRSSQSDPQPRSAPDAGADRNASPAPMPANRQSGGGFLGGFGCIGLIVIGVVIFIIFRLIGRFLNRNRNGPTGGYGGQGYGGQQGYGNQGMGGGFGGGGGGGGFGRGMLGGVLGGLFGSYLGNQTFGNDSSATHHDTAGGSTGSNDPGFNGPPDNGGSSGADFGDSGSSGADFGGGGDSGGGDSGGSSGSDF